MHSNIFKDYLPQYVVKQSPVKTQLEHVFMTVTDRTHMSELVVKYYIFTGNMLLYLHS